MTNKLDGTPQDCMNYVERATIGNVRRNNSSQIRGPKTPATREKIRTQADYDEVENELLAMKTEVDAMILYFELQRQIRIHRVRVQAPCRANGHATGAAGCLCVSLVLATHGRGAGSTHQRG